MNAATLGQRMDQAVERRMVEDVFAATGKTIAQMDEITRTRSCFATFADLLNAQGNYRPTISIRSREDLLLALAYDAAQSARGDERRAFTAGSMPQVGDPVRFYRGTWETAGRIVKVGPRRIKVSYVTRGERKYALRHPGHICRRLERFLRLTDCCPRPALGDVVRAWEAR